MLSAGRKQEGAERKLFVRLEPVTKSPNQQNECCASQWAPRPETRRSLSACRFTQRYSPPFLVVFTILTVICRVVSSAYAPPEIGLLFCFPETLFRKHLSQAEIINRLKCWSCAWIRKSLWKFLQAFTYQVLPLLKWQWRQQIYCYELESSSSEFFTENFSLFLTIRSLINFLKFKK